MDCYRCLFSIKIIGRDLLSFSWPLTQRKGLGIGYDLRFIPKDVLCYNLLGTSWYLVCFLSSISRDGRSHFFQLRSTNLVGSSTKIVGLTIDLIYFFVI